MSLHPCRTVAVRLSRFTVHFDTVFSVIPTACRTIPQQAVDGFTIHYSTVRTCPRHCCQSWAPTRNSYSNSHFGWITVWLKQASGLFSSHSTCILMLDRENNLPDITENVQITQFIIINSTVQNNNFQHQNICHNAIGIDMSVIGNHSLECPWSTNCQQVTDDPFKC